MTLLDGDDKIKIEFEATGADLDQGTGNYYFFILISCTEKKHLGAIFILRKGVLRLF